MGRRKQTDIEGVKIGHNSQVMTADAELLKSYLKQHDEIDEQRAQLNADRKEIRDAMREKGFDMKAFDEARRRSKLSEMLANTCETYMHVLGMLGPLTDTPLGQAAVAREFAETVGAQAAG